MIPFTKIFTIFTGAKLNGFGLFAALKSIISPLFKNGFQVHSPQRHLAPLHIAPLAWILQRKIKFAIALEPKLSSSSRAPAPYFCSRSRRGCEKQQPPFNLLWWIIFCIAVFLLATALFPFATPLFAPPFSLGVACIQPAHAGDHLLKTY